MINYNALVKHLSVADGNPFALLSHQASPTGGILRNAFGPRLAALLSPEHGWFGLAEPGEKTASGRHPGWDVPVHSLYGETRRPTAEMLDGCGRLVVDLQDIGVRCYTYLATLKNALETAAELRLPVTVLDRPIPLGGILDGPSREMSYASFVAPLDIPMCHGMTPGECAKFIDAAEQLDLDLTIIKMRDWSHHNRAPWANFMPPSPGIPSWDSAALYPATLFTEAYPALDCDRAGPLSFRVLGAPWLDSASIIDDLSEYLQSCGVAMRPYRYRPARGKYKDSTLDGILLSVENEDAFYPITAGVIILAAIMQRHGGEICEGARPEWLDKLTGSSAIRDAIASDSLGNLFTTWINDQDAYLPAKVNLY